MVRFLSARRMFRDLRRRLRQQIGLPQRQLADSYSMAAPQVRMLEPRLVLNATAELNLLGQLVVEGTDVDETVRLDVQQGELQFRDELNRTIPIEIAATGQSVDSLDPALVTSGQMLFDLKGGDDNLDLELPSGLDVLVTDGDGQDTTHLRFAPLGPGAPAASSDLVEVNSDQITLGPTQFVSLKGNDVVLRGEVQFGVAGQRSVLDVADGSLEVEQRLALSGEVTIVGAGPVDVSGAAVTAATPGTELRVELAPGPSSDLSLGTLDASAGNLLTGLRVAAADSVILRSTSGITVDGDLEIQNVGGTTLVDATINADSVLITVDGNLTLAADDAIRVNDGQLTLATSSALLIDGDLSTVADPSVGPQPNVGTVNLFGQTVRLETTNITTAGGLVNVSGPVMVAGDVAIDSGDQGDAPTAGRVQFFDTIEAADGIGDTLTIAARGRDLDGTVRFEGPVGVFPGATDLNGLTVDAGSLETDSIEVAGGSIDVTAGTIRLVGTEIRTLGSGDVNLNGVLLLPVNDTTVESAGRAVFSAEVKGQTGTRDFFVTANADAVFEGPVIQLQDFDVSADRVLVRADVDTTFPAQDGTVRWNADTSVIVDSDAVVNVGEAQLLVDAGGGLIDMSASTARGDASGEVITLQNALNVMLGDVQVADGILTVGVNHNVSGEISQAAGAAVVVDRLVASTVGAVTLSNSDNEITTLQSVVTRDGRITIESRGTVNVLEVDSLSEAGAERDVLLTATGRSSDLMITSVVARNNADVELIAGDDILDSDRLDDARVVADDLKLTAGNADTGTGADASIRLTTDINDLQAEVGGTGRGDLIIRDVGDLNLAASDAAGDEIVQTANGQIIVTAANITIVDTSVGDDGADLKADPELVARGSENGRIDLQADGELRLGDDVQLRAEKLAPPEPPTRPSVDMPLDGPQQGDPQLDQEDRSIYLTSESIVLGDRIELNTGQTQGVARIFSPRPLLPVFMLDPITGDPIVAKPSSDQGTAFFIPSSVETNTLEQALVNDAIGILTIDIGQPGERGLTVDIDWGAPNESDPNAVGEFGNRPRRFQQINSISADQAVVVSLGGSEGIDPVVIDAPPGSPPRLVVEHFYSQANIVDSTANDRDASTKPLEVRFAVRHHESIFIEAGSVSQAGGPSEAVAGRVVSSTDDPTNARDGSDGLTGLESGRALFLIPSLTIPLAFVPVRDVIPEFETPDVVIRTETIVPLTNTTVETSETSVTVSFGRDEYIRIRVLSPDPEGADLIEPRRLPNSILEGDNLRKMLERLPDGQYEIEYVLGDTNTRSILRVDVRGGEAIIPEEGLDEGILRLKQINEDLERSDREAEDESTRGAAIQHGASDSERISRVSGDSAKIVPTLATEAPLPMQDGMIRQDDAQQQQENAVEVHSGRHAMMIPATMIWTTSALARRRRQRLRPLSAASRFASRTNPKEDPQVRVE